MERGSGVLMHISSLPSNYGIGTFGKKAYEFVDFLSYTGQKYWQVLPMGPTTYGDSPYLSTSSYAGNPYFIDPEFLVSDGLITEEELDEIDFGDVWERVDYGKIYSGRERVFSIICQRFSDDNKERFREFCNDQAFWLDDYALYTSLKEEKGGTSWFNFGGGLKHREKEALREATERLQDAIRKHKILQFLFFRQWNALKNYANLKGIRIIGDLPIYVPYDSCDVWCNKDVFLLDGDGRPRDVSGCPPDLFSPSGQKWGTPLYDWSESNRDKVYDWWKKRISSALGRCDILRIDHFRAFADYYAVPANDETAEGGEWRQGPGMDFINYMKGVFGELPIIAEDLGSPSESLSELMRSSSIPGMRVLQFAFDGNSENPNLPYNYPRNCVAYIGTHDNDTAKGWLSHASEKELELARKYIGLDGDGDVWSMIRTLYGSVADTVIVTVQDLLFMGDEGRMNTPSTEQNNWRFRVCPDYINKISPPRLKAVIEVFGR